MNRLISCVNELTSKKPSRSPALMTHVVLGYPTLEKSIELVRAMADAGASIIELQIPFSDPMADGPTIMAANEHALAQGLRVRDSFRAAEKLAHTVTTPLLFMSYFNILYRYGEKKKKDGVDGTEAFCRDAARSGISGLIVPDVPAGSSETYWQIAKDAKLSAIPIVTPVSTDARLRAIRGTDPSGFVYCVTTTGTTGARKALPADLSAYLGRIRKQFSLPLAVGFGISSREQVRALHGKAEIAIVGSAVIDVIKAVPPKEAVKRVSKFVGQLLS